MKNKLFGLGLGLSLAMAPQVSAGENSKASLIEAARKDTPIGSFIQKNRDLAEMLFNPHSQIRKQVMVLENRSIADTTMCGQITLEKMPIERALRLVLGGLMHPQDDIVDYKTQDPQTGPHDILIKSGIYSCLEDVSCVFPKGQYIKGPIIDEDGKFPSSISSIQRNVDCKY